MREDALCIPSNRRSSTCHDLLSIIWREAETHQPSVTGAVWASGFGGDNRSANLPDPPSSVSSPADQAGFFSVSVPFALRPSASLVTPDYAGLSG
jgi:hypothetical protein